MKLSAEAREVFREFGRAGGRERARRLTPEKRSQVARRAAIVRWVHERFGSSSFAALGLPGGDTIDAGLEDLATDTVSAESLAVSLAAPRLRREGVPVGSTLDDPERRLYAELAADNPDLAHARYGAWLRRMVSFADACRFARLDRD